MTRLRSSSCSAAPRLWRSILVASLAAALSSAPNAHAAESTETTDSVGLGNPIFRVNVREVGIIFTALGNHNKSLPKINPSDVRVFDDGVPAQVTSLRAAALPIRLGLLIDASASVDKELQTEVSLASDFATKFLRGADTASVMLFASKPEPMLEMKSGADVQRSLRAVDAGGLTALYDSVIKGCSDLFAPETARKVVILISDGDDTDSYHTQAQVFDKAKRSGAVVYAIYIQTKTSGPDHERWMKRLADITGGRAFRASGQRELKSALAEIERDVRSGYLLTFRPPRQFAHGKFHQVSVVPRQRHISIRSQAGYVPK